MDKYEYKVYKCILNPVQMQEDINEFGKQGWQLVSTVADIVNTKTVCYVVMFFQRKLTA